MAVIKAAALGGCFSPKQVYLLVSAMNQSDVRVIFIRESFSLFSRLFPLRFRLSSFFLRFIIQPMLEAAKLLLPRQSTQVGTQHVIGIIEEWKENGRERIVYNYLLTFL